MELKFYGANCIKIATKQRTIVIDDNLSELGLKTVTKENECILYTNKNLEPKKLPKADFTNDCPGEFELGSLMVQGFPVRSYKDEAGEKTGVLYSFIIDRMTVVVTGHIHPDIDSSLLDTLGPVDALVIPVGGAGVTLDHSDVLKINNKLSPRFLIPTHFADKSVNYPIAQEDTTKLLEELKQEAETLDSLKLKPSAALESSGTHVVILTR